MGLLGVLGSIAGGVGKGVLEEANRQIKKNTGIDFAKELQPNKKELDKLKMEQKMFEESKEEYIKLYGEKAYQEELSLYRQEANLIRQAIISDVRELTYEATMNRNEEYTYRVKNLTDKQLLHLRKRDIPEFLQKITDDEMRNRGL